MTKLKSLWITFLLLTTCAVHAQNNLIPMDSAVHMGRLANGLTYYIRHNNWPEHRANFYIVQRVGSLQENDQQRGLAHFLEHMCFNGSKHFKGNAIIRYCESIGVQFGNDLNAYTDIDETVYNISNVPTTRKSSLDSCLLILSDLANGLTLDPVEIDKERGVIHEEWRQGEDAEQRMYERALPLLYPDCKYGQRMPIGLMSVVDSFKPQALRDYYEKWYRPDNQGIIIVGDVDVNHVEKKIKELFGGIKLPKYPAPVLPIFVPDNDEPIVVVEKDKEEDRSDVSLMFKHSTIPDSVKQHVEYLVEEFVKQTAVSMLNRRFSEAAEKRDCPYLYADADYDSYINARTEDAFSISVSPKEDKIEEALQAALTEARRTAKYGFTDTEYQREKAEALSNLDRIYMTIDKTDNEYYYKVMKGNFLDHEPMPSQEYYCQVMKQVVPNIPLEYANQMIRDLVSESDTNMVITSFNQEKDGKVYPTREGLLKAVDKARKAELEPFIDKVRNEPLIKELPVPGKIVKEKYNKKFDFKELTLSNGIKVLLKKTNLQKDEVWLLADSRGGRSVFGEKDWANTRLFDVVIGSCGLGNFNSTELQKALSGKNANVDLSMTDPKNKISGSSTPKDLETLFQMTYLYFTHINKDTAEFERMMHSFEIGLKNQDLSSDKAFSDSVVGTTYGHNRLIRSLEVSDLKNVSLDRIIEMAKEITANPGAYNFIIVGNFDEDSIRPLLERYIASLSSKSEIKEGHHVGTEVNGVVTCNFTRQMETPSAQTFLLWHNAKIKWTLENEIKADVAGRILEMIYLKKIREDAGAAYSVEASGITKHYMDGYTNVLIQVDCSMKPEQAQQILQILRQEVDSLALKCEQEKLDKVKTLLLKEQEDNLKDNSYWVSILNAYHKYGVDWSSDYNRIVSSLKPQDICDFMKELLKPGNRIEVTMLPKKKE